MTTRISGNCANRYRMNLTMTPPQPERYPPRELSIYFILHPSSFSIQHSASSIHSALLLQPHVLEDRDIPRIRQHPVNPIPAQADIHIMVQRNDRHLRI